MNIISGASGQVGSHIVKALINSGSPVRAIVRDQNTVFDSKTEVRTADLFNPAQLTDAMEGGTTAFLLTPEDPTSHDLIGDTKRIIDSYRQAIRSNGISKIVGLSCVGAHIEENTGNILMSRMLEHGFDDLDIDKIFIRPSYYFSNWLGFRETIEQYGILPTFFPESLQIDMNSPVDIAQFIAKAMTTQYQSKDKKIFELVGPQKYSSRHVAETFSKLLNKNTEVQSIPREEWNETLATAGFTQNTSANLMEMTQAVIDNVVTPEHHEKTVKLSTTLEQYLKERLNK